MWEIYVHFTILLLALACWAAKFSKMGLELKLVGSVLALTLFLEGYAAYLALNMTKNLFLYHWLIPVQYIVFSLAYAATLSNPLFKRGILISIPTYLLLVLLITLHLQSIAEFNSYARILKNVLIISWTLLYYKEIFASLKVINLGKEPMFWVSTGLLFFSLGSFFTEGLMNHLLNLSYELAHTLNYISIFLKYLLNITFTIAFWFGGQNYRQDRLVKAKLHL